MSAAFGAGAGGPFGGLRPRGGARDGRIGRSGSGPPSRGDLVRRAASAAAASSSYFQRVKGWSGPLKAAVTSGSLCAVGDVLAQSIAGWYAAPGAETGAAGAGAAATAAAGKKGKGAAAAASAASAAQQQQPQNKKPYDPCRTARMAGFGLLFYGPYQYYWYSLLEHLMPARTVPNFVSKVAANQILLAPVTLTVAFAWHLAFSKTAAAAPPLSAAAKTAAKTAAAAPKSGAKGSARAAPDGDGKDGAPPGAAASLGGLLAARLAPLPDKLRADFAPALVTGWKFWVPAASVNFCAVPLRHQVPYMSCCGVLWTAYLSHVSGAKIGGAAAAAPAAAAAARRA